MLGTYTKNIQQKYILRIYAKQIYCTYNFSIKQKNYIFHMVYILYSLYNLFVYFMRYMQSMWFLKPHIHISLSHYSPAICCIYLSQLICLILDFLPLM